MTDKKYSVWIELTTIEKQVIEVAAKSPIHARIKIEELINNSESRCYSYLPVGEDEKLQILRINEVTDE